MKRLELKTKRGIVSTCFWQGPKDGPVLHWAHANGFNGQTYASLLNKLTSSYNIYAWDTPGYGKSLIGENYDSKNPIQGYALDLEAFIEALHIKHKKKILLAGHSMGGSLSIMIGSSMKDKIEGMILADPVVISLYYKYLTRFLGPLGYISSTIQLTNQALNKRNKWESYEHLLNSYKGRGAFKTWRPDFLKDYIKGGTKEEKGMITLSCLPETEAASFRNTEIIATPKIIKNISVPVTLMVAEHGSTTSSKNSFDALKTEKKVITIEKGSHFFPMEMPELVIKEIKSFKLESKNL
jgi:pimeloyl-ACP methyl ester carboxylesterase